MDTPLPELSTRDLGCCGVFHQVGDGDRSGAAEPGVDIPQCNADVIGDAVIRDLGAFDFHIQQNFTGDLHIILCARVFLVRALSEDAIENLHCNRHEIRVCDPGAIESL